MSVRCVARTAATLKKVEPRVGTRNAHREKRWFSTSASSAGSSTRASTIDTLSAPVEWVNATAAPTPAQKKDDSDGATQRAFAAGLYISLAAAAALPFLG